MSQLEKIFLTREREIFWRKEREGLVELVFLLIREPGRR
jgi:hypothetical protein